MRARLTGRAKADLKSIYNYTVDRFGHPQWDVYREKLISGIETITGFPDIGIAAAVLPPGVRAFRSGYHWIIYATAEQECLILALVGNLDSFAQTRE